MNPFRYTLNTCNHNNLNQTVFTGDIIWKYMSVEGFEDLVTKSRLKLTILTKWQDSDPFEGVYDERQLILRDGGNPQLSDEILRDPVLFSGHLDHMKIYQNQTGITTKELRDQMRFLEEGAFAASFHINDEPNEYMLKHYGDVAIRMSIGKLDVELDKDGKFFQTGRIEYLTDSWTAIPEVFYAAMFYKLEKYIEEKEYRVFTIDDKHYDEADPSSCNLFIHIDLPSLVDGIYFNPELDARVIRRIREAAKVHGIKVLPGSFLERLKQIFRGRGKLIGASQH